MPFTVGSERWVSLAATAALLMSAAFPQSAVARDAGTHGGGGGLPFRLECKAGEIATAFHTYAGSALDAIAVQCGVLSADGKSFVNTNFADGDTKGGAGGAPQKFGCPADNGVKELYVWNDKHNVVNHVEMACMPLSGGNLVVVKPSSIGGDPIQPAAVFKCDGPNEWVVGVYGRSGSLVDAIGPICGTRVPAAAIQPPAKPDPQEVSDMDPKGKTVEECTAARVRNEQRCEKRMGGNIEALTACRQQALQIFGACMSLAVQDGEPTQPAQKTAEVVQSIDVYDAPGGDGNQTGALEPGTTVNLVGCEDNWCHIGGAQVPNGDGYVYNGPDYRSLRF